MVHEGGESERGNFKATQAVFGSALVLRIMPGGQAGSLQLWCTIVPLSLASETLSTMEEKAWGGREASLGKGCFQGEDCFTEVEDEIILPKSNCFSQSAPN